MRRAALVAVILGTLTSLTIEILTSVPSDTRFRDDGYIHQYARDLHRCNRVQDPQPDPCREVSVVAFCRLAGFVMDLVHQRIGTLRFTSSES